MLCLRPSMPRLALILMMLAAPASLTAQPIPFHPEKIEDCLSGKKAGPQREACIGLAADLCRRETKGATEVEAAACMAAEANWWRDRMGNAYEAAMKEAALRDVEFAKSISQGAPRMTEDLEKMQEAWKDWSEKRCFFEAMRRRGKPDRMVVASECLMRRTAEEALLLEDVAARKR
ncbi:lysozyme inhibitor LprI family protein [Cereibacter azotoformans]|uniref:Lysozyme inhibitor LprI-like N-terminal domain-containing protein n=1 Tax=Cereibacter sphaeroides (strain ATCC 17025 / ATH 2.4.3) TaxID=349102 RepID=A4WXS2_CERS5|nr:lysozyme inhibitor LprI family protein [Cereibacter azotoformans]ULB11641.1 lysozyme inhibitor LprI family protein [Cereibacter azotoformans]